MMRRHLPALALLAAAAAALCRVPPAEAQHCAPARVVRYHAPTYHSPVVVKKEVAVVKEVVPVIHKFVAVIPLVDLPTYSAVYAPPVVVPPVPVNPAPVQQQQQPDWKLVMDTLRDIGARLKRLEDGQAQPARPKDPFAPQPQKGPQGALGVVQQKCASCHSEASAPEKGGGFVMVGKDGALPKFSAAASAKVLKRSYNGTMPPKDAGIAPLTDAEVAALADIDR